MIDQNLRSVLYDRIQKASKGIKTSSLWIEDGLWNFLAPKEKASELARILGIPSNCTQAEQGEKILFQWASHADGIFSSAGLLSKSLDGYEMREPQLHAARLFEMGINIGASALMEAGTGTGKSLIALAICASMGKKVIISTSNKALQQQYFTKDAPFVSSLFGGLKIALSQGKGNYICNKKMANDNPPQALVGWHKKTETGSTQEIDFKVNYSDFTVGDDCTGKQCSFYEECFYYKAKEALQEADIIITNHMIVCLDQMIPEANMLPNANVLVIDECHQLASYARNAIGTEFSKSKLQKRADALWDAGVEMDLTPAIDSFMSDIASYKPDSNDREVGINIDDEFPSGNQLANLFEDGADELWDEQDIPDGAEQKKAQNVARSLRNVAVQLRAISAKTPNGFTRWIRNEYDKDLGHTVAKDFVIAPYDVSSFVGRIAGFDEVLPYEPDPTRCHRCQQILTAETVHVLNGNVYGPTCIHHVDVLHESESMNRDEWLSLDHSEEPEITKKKKAVLFMSATMATPDMEHFKSEHGIKYGLEMIVDSPFDYENNVQLYIPNGSSPPPNSKEYQTWLTDEISNLVSLSGGGSLLLFTSYTEMNYQEQILHGILSAEGYQIFKQGNLPKMALIEKFKVAKKGVLFATKSFWEGVNIPGNDLSLVVINKMPFPALSPLFQARSAHVERQGKKSFFALSLPEATLDLKQGFGRLVRTQTDKGTVAILDSRLHTKSYGKQVVNSLPPARLITEL